MVAHLPTEEHLISWRLEHRKHMRPQLSTRVTHHLRSSRGLRRTVPLEPKAAERAEVGHGSSNCTEALITDRVAAQVKVGELGRRLGLEGLSKVSRLDAAPPKRGAAEVAERGELSSEGWAHRGEGRARWV